MSGHSKWATTHRQKAVTDAKRGAIFTRLAKAVTIAARDKGGDPETNFSLRLAIDKARGANMPKDNIDRAIKRGTGEIEGAAIEAITYEGYGPEGVAILIHSLTDNSNRAVNAIKHILGKNGGNLGAPNCVQRMFTKKSSLGIPTTVFTDELELALIEEGAEDIARDGDLTLITAAPEYLNDLKNILESQKITPEFAEYDYISATTVSLSEDAATNLDRILELLDECEDVEDFYTNRA